MKQPMYFFMGKAIPLRQVQVWERIALSRTIKEIALELGVSNKTVEYHSMRLRERIGLWDVAALTRAAIQCRLITL